MRNFILAEFPTGDHLVRATQSIREQGFAGLDTYSPYPLHHGDEALGLPKSKVPLIALIGGLTGAIGGYVMQWYLNAVEWPINVGNRLAHSPPTNIPITFELTVLISGLSIFFGLMALCRLPQPYHPVFESEQFQSASTHGFWLSVEVEESTDRAGLSEKLARLGATHVTGVQEEAK
jgi:hypothetical protein